MKYVDVAVRLDAPAARDRAAQELEARKFKVKWEDDWYAVAERGNKWLNAVAGALAQYFKVGIRVMGADEVTVVRFEKLSSGWLGGAIGAMRVEKQMKALRDDFASAFDSVGLLAGVSEG
jgi:hypothetical protein